MIFVRNWLQAFVVALFLMVVAFGVAGLVFFVVWLLWQVVVAMPLWSWLLVGVLAGLVYALDRTDAL